MSAEDIDAHAERAQPDATSEIRALAKAMLEAGVATVDDGPFFPLGGTLGRDGQVRIVVPELGDSIGAMRDALVRSLSQEARSGGIKAAGVITQNVLPHLGTFLALSVQHEDSTNVAFVQRFTLGPDGKPLLDDDLLMQKGAYEFFPAEKAAPVVEDDDGAAAEAGLGTARSHRLVVAIVVALTVVASLVRACAG